MAGLHVHPVHSIRLRRQVRDKGHFHRRGAAEEPQRGAGQQQPFWDTGQLAGGTRKMLFFYFFFFKQQHKMGWNHI